MANVNKVILIGRLGNQPELRRTPSNHAVADLRIAVNHTWTDRNGQRQEKADWFTVVVWDKQAEICEKYLTKGREIYVEGRLTNEEWNDKEGQKRTTTKVIADRVQFIGGRGDEARGGGDGGERSYSGGAEAGRAPARSQPAPGMAEPGPDSYTPEDDIPF